MPVTAGARVGKLPPPLCRLILCLKRNHWRDRIAVQLSIAGGLVVRVSQSGAVPDQIFDSLQAY